MHQLRLFTRTLSFIFLSILLLNCKKKEEYFKDSINGRYKLDILVDSFELNKSFVEYDINYLIYSYKKEKNTSTWVYLSINQFICPNKKLILEIDHKVYLYHDTDTLSTSTNIYRSQLPILNIDSTGFYKRGKKIGWWYYFNDGRFKFAKLYKRNKIIQEIDSSMWYSKEKRFNRVKTDFLIGGYPYYSLKKVKNLNDSLHPLYYTKFRRLCVNMKGRITKLDL